VGFGRHDEFCLYVEILFSGRGSCIFGSRKGLEKATEWTQGGISAASWSMRKIYDLLNVRKKSRDPVFVVQFFPLAPILRDERIDFLVTCYHSRKKG